MNKDEEFNDWLCEREDGIGYSFEKSKGDIEEDINKLIEELINVRPDELSKEGLKLFNKINEIIDKNKELEEFKKQVTEIENTNFIKYKNYIPVSLVEEKIEELKEKGESDLKTYGFAIDTHLAKQVLEELLENNDIREKENVNFN